MITPPPAPTPWSTGRSVRAVMVVVVALVGLDLLASDNGVVAGMRARRERESLQRDLEAIRRENLQLIEQARRLREDPSTIESVARRDLGLIRPGEKLFILREREAR